MKDMSFLGRISLRIATVLIPLTILLIITGNEHIFKAVGNTYLKGRTGPSIDEYKIFETRKVKSYDFTQIPFNFHYNFHVPDSLLMDEIESYKPSAFLMLFHGQLIFEKYWDGYYENSITNSFSVAKSIVGLGVGIAADKGILGLDDKVIQYVPELEGEFREEVTIRHLLSMTSGIDFGESYANPFGFMAKAYYGDELMKKTFEYEAETKPGTEWEYLGGNTILLSIILSRASGMNLSDFISEHLWKQIGPDADAIWNLDAKGGIEKAYCCFYATARDFARIGQVVLDDGYYNNRFVVSPEFIHELRKPVLLENGEFVEHYGLHWWRIKHNNKIVTYARGILGQYIITIPAYNMVIVRLGHKRGDKDEFEHPEDLYLYLKWADNYMNNWKAP